MKFLSILVVVLMSSSSFARIDGPTTAESLEMLRDQAESLEKLKDQVESMINFMSRPDLLPSDAENMKREIGKILERIANMPRFAEHAQKISEAAKRAFGNFSDPHLKPLKGHLLGFLNILKAESEFEKIVSTQAEKVKGIVFNDKKASPTPVDARNLSGAKTH